MKTIGYIATTIIIIVFGTVLNGWALSKLWSWFIVQTFNMPALDIPEAIGMALVISFLTQQTSYKKSEEEYWEILLKGAITVTLRPAFVLIFGAIVKLWL